MTDAAQLAVRYLLALCIWREARGEIALGKRFVGQVIENRKNDPRWPHDYVQVIVQPLQFSSFNSNDPNARLFPSPDDKAWPDCVAAADDVLTGDTVFTTANHYHVRGLEPSWANPAKITEIVGHHVFYRL